MQGGPKLDTERADCREINPRVPSKLSCELRPWDLSVGAEGRHTVGFFVLSDFGFQLKCLGDVIQTI